jgi:CspA family cold shock protein
MSRGRIKRLITERGFGFIETAQGEDLFFHCSKLREIEFADLHENQIVEFDVAQFPQGLQAVNIRPITLQSESSAHDNGWAGTAPSTSESYFDEAREEEYFPPEEESDALTQREQLFIRLAVNITRGSDSAVRDQLDAARQLGIDRTTLSSVIDRISKANADVCRSVTNDHI